MRLILLLLSILSASFLLFAEDELDKRIPLANLDNTVPTIVDGCVSVITGDFLLWKTDLIVSGPEPIAFEWMYTSSDYNRRFYGGWRHNHHSYVQMSHDRKGHPYAIYTETSGKTGTYRSDSKSKKEHILNLLLKENSKGLTNISSGTISGQTNAKNVKLQYDSKNKHLTASNGMGHEMIFSCKNTKAESPIYRLQVDKKKNGNKLHYKHKNGFLSEVTSTNASEDVIFGSIKFNQHFGKALKKDPTFTLESGDGRNITYHLVRLKSSIYPDSYAIKKVVRSDAPDQWFEYYASSHIQYGELLNRCCKPDNRYKCIEYNLIGKNRIAGEKKDLKAHDYRVNRVNCLKAPVGTTPEPIVTHQFHYKFKLKDEYSRRNYEYGCTTVYDAYNHKTTYEIDKEHRLTSIKRWEGTKNYKLKTVEEFTWGNKNWKDTGNLLGKRIFNGTGNLLVACHYEYDDFGNLIRDELKGNITGKGTGQYIQTYEYSKDGNNLLLKEKHPSGKVVQYNYHPETNLLSRKLLYNGNEIVEREFYEYDSNGVLIKTITDDGSSLSKDDLANVTSRHIINVTPSSQYPIGLPIQKEECYLDLKTGRETLLKRVSNTYSPEGLLTQQEIYDCHNHHQYTLSWKYDNHGNILSHVKALGYEMIYQYDANDNLIYEEGPSPTPKKYYTFDYMNRLIAVKEVHTDGTVLTTMHHYDYLGNKIETIDAYGHAHQFEYDDFGRVIAIHSPEDKTSQGEIIKPVVRHEYDIFGNITALTDANGYTTQTSYNVFSKPTAIAYPDGSSEIFEYNHDGSLKQKINKAGLKTTYTYDALQRPVTEDQYSPNGELMLRKENIYKGKQLIATIDAGGYQTINEYDATGRIIATRREEKYTSYEYDSMGRISVTKEWFSNKEFKATIHEFDHANQVIEERIEDTHGNVLKKVMYTYDAMGNRTTETLITSQGPVTTFTEYNGSGKPIKIIDAEGHVTRYVYDHYHINDYGQQVLKITAVDPLGNQTIKALNAKGQEASVIRMDAYGNILAKKECYYDCNGNLETTIDWAISSKGSRKITTEFCYDTMNRPITTIEAVGTLEQKVLTTTYHVMGEKAAITKADGKIIHYDYNPLSQLIHLYDDDSLSYTYEYDKLGNIISVDDQVYGGTLTREYDHACRMLTEGYGGFVFKYEYDPLGRLKHVILPDHSGIEYQYDPLHLKEIQRVNSSNSYSYQYISYDLTGRLMTAKMINGQEINYKYDQLGRVIGIVSETIQENVEYDVVGNLMRTSLNSKVSEYKYDSNYQITSECGVEEHHYENDSLNNHLSVDGEETQHNDLHQLLKKGGNQYHYDENGNRIEVNGQQNAVYSYDVLDRLIAVQLDEQRYEYHYDSFHRRISKTHFEKIGGNWKQKREERYLYLGENEVGTVNEEGKIYELRILGRGLGAEIGASIAFEIDGSVYVPIHDHNGNVVKICGEVVENYQYSAFGSEKIEGKGISPWRFASKRKDAETGFIFFGRRYYDPASCCWVTSDPLGLTAGPNLYAYVKNSPLCHFDLYGLEWVRAQDKGLFQRQNYLQSCGRAFTELLRLPGRIIHSVGENLVPIPIVRDVITMVGRFLSNQGLRWCADYRATPSQSKKTDGSDYPNDVTMFCNGIMNSKGEVDAKGEQLSRSLGRSVVNVVYNSTHGFASDVLECLAQIVGIETRSVKIMTQTMKEAVNKVGPDGRVWVYAHSQGGLITWRALQKLTSEERNVMHIATFGSAKLIPEKGLGSAVNFVSEKDPVPFLADPINYIKAKLGHQSNVHFLHSNAKLPLDHTYNDDTYSTAVKYFSSYHHRQIIQGEK